VAKELWSHNICNIKKQNWEELLLLENVLLDAPMVPNARHRKDIYQRILYPIDRIFYILFPLRINWQKSSGATIFCNIKKQNWSQMPDIGRIYIKGYYYILSYPKWPIWVNL
jgi:hypothetical protein